LTGKRCQISEIESKRKEVSSPQEVLRQFRQGDPTPQVHRPEGPQNANAIKPGEDIHENVQYGNSSCQSVTKGTQGLAATGQRNEMEEQGNARINLGYSTCEGEEDLSRTLEIASVVMNPESDEE